MNRDPRLRLLERGYGLALRLYPRAFREQWGDAMRQAFRDRCREVARGQRGFVALAREMIADVAAGAGREHAGAADAAAPRRWWLALACMLLFAATLAAREQAGGVALAAGEALAQGWAHAQAALDRRAAAHYWQDVAAQARETGAGHAAEALALLAAHAPVAAQEALRAGIAAGERDAFWLVATTCRRDPDCGIDVDEVLAQWQRVEPGNAAPALFAFERASVAGDPVAEARALARAAGAPAYRAYDAALVKSLFPAAEAVDVPSRLRAAPGTGRGETDAMAGDALALQGWSAFALPRFDALAQRCRPGGTLRDGDCLAVARLLSDSTVLLGRVTGERLLCRYLCDGPGRAQVAARIADRRWVLGHYGDVAWRPEWIRAWRADGVRGEFDALQRALRARGIAAIAPSGYGLPARDLDPQR